MNNYNFATEKICSAHMRLFVAHCNVGNCTHSLTCQLCPRYEGQLTRMAEPIPPSGQSSSYSLTTLSSSRSTDRRAETDRMVGDADAGMCTILDTV